ncbi:hypothetical protein M436DRAFT_65685 [Aureobasidium namibiae CBS 147.97]|uniref:Alpha/beta hydrolase fold-3 domain-containing protein n=1 Tax=Aureobasidium namibiae CBS 147.97 TaxID=1043004 RepID=A0A074WD15_9PEZI|nr:uncharacterized protein M436DRAFT_65685 [Aureobasidium namibiae CBS 147.97]KEQ70863.1 hypothetical protein M436DRAFT_65685 [Aureobasidium namibiae CBS 147.97]
MTTPPLHKKHISTYKTHANTPIKLDIYRPLPTLPSHCERAHQTQHTIAIAKVYIHPYYRVLPQSNGFAVIQDVLAACHWIAENPTECGRTTSAESTRQSLDIVFAGASAGGWCTLVAALHFCAQPPDAVSQVSLKPKALLLLYSMLCLGNPRWCEPIFAAPEPMCEAAVHDHLVFAEQRIRDTEISLDYLTGIEGFAADVVNFGIEATIKKRRASEPEENNLEVLFPTDFADFKRFSAAVPTIIVHGTTDYEVPISESETLVQKIKNARNSGSNTGVVRLYPVENAEHVFDLGIDAADLHINTSDMERKGIKKEHISVLQKVLRDIRILVQEAW